MKTERKQLEKIIKHVLSPLSGRPVVVNKQEFNKQCMMEGLIERDYLGIGTNYTWHGAPDARCDIDIVAVDLLREETDGNISDSSTGARKGIEMKRRIEFPGQKPGNRERGDVFVRPPQPPTLRKPTSPSVRAFG